MQKYFDILGIQQGINAEELKKAYRDLSKKYHPDANHNNPLRDLAEAKFKEINEAYEKIKEYLEKGFSSEEETYDYSEDVTENESYFNILNRKLVITKEHVFYLNLEKLCNQDISQMTNYVSDVYNNSGNIEKMLNSGFSKIMDTLIDSIDKYARFLVENGCYTATKSSIKNQYGEELLAYIKDIYSNFYDENYRIDLQNQIATAERKIKKAVRSFDNKGGIRNAFSIAANYVDKVSSKSGLYNSPQLIKGLKDSVNYFYNDLSLIVCDLMNLLPLEEYIEITKSNSVIQNFNQIKQADKEKALFDALQGHPYNFELYNLILKTFGDEKKELEKLSNVFGYSITNMKNKIMWSNQENTSTASLGTYEKFIGLIEAKGKQLGLSNKQNEYLQSLIQGKQALIQRIKEEEERKKIEEEFRKEQERLRKIAEEEARMRALNEKNAVDIIRNLKSIPSFDSENKIVSNLLLDLYSEKDYRDLLMIYGDQFNELVELEQLLKVDISKIKNDLVKEKFREMISDEKADASYIISSLEGLVNRLGLEGNEILNYLKINPEYAIEGERKKIELEKIEEAKQLELKNQEEERQKKEIASQKIKDFFNFIIGLAVIIGIGFWIYTSVKNKAKKEEISTPAIEQTATTASTEVIDDRHAENLHSSLLNFESPVLQFCTGKYITRIDKLSTGKYRYASFDYPKTISDKPNTVLETGYFDSDSSSFKFPFKAFTYVVVINNGQPVSLEVYKNDNRILQKDVQSIDYSNVVNVN